MVKVYVSFLFWKKKRQGFDINIVYFPNFERRSAAPNSLKTYKGRGYLLEEIRYAFYDYDLTLTLLRCIQTCKRN